MSLKAFAAKILARSVHKKNRTWIENPIQSQEKVLRDLIKSAKNTAFGKDHGFDQIENYQDFKQRVPIRDYEELKHYIERAVKGEESVLWPGSPHYFAKTSGTTSGAKYIPITKESMPFHIKAAKDAILNYIHQTGNAEFVDGKMIFLQGSPILQEKNGIKLGRLSGIVAHYVPSYLQKNRMPSWETNCIEDWETKVDAIVEETVKEDMTVISGIPSWVQMYFERIKQKTSKEVGEVFKNFNLFIYGGVNFEPYRAKFENLIGRSVDSIELFPASEGFFAYQDLQNEVGMLLLVDAGIYYEFVEADQFFDDNPTRISLESVKLGVNYVMLISTNAGLWGYNLGDTVVFTSIKPYRIIVSGRIKHFISAFGEHVIAKEVEQAMKIALESCKATVNEFSVAPQITPPLDELPYHQWLVEFENQPKDLESFAVLLDQALQQQNSYYFDLIQGKVLQPLKIHCLAKDTFKKYMKSKGKLGGQNKVQRLANDRALADELLKISNA
ncbi:GH3 auxin-responsive promoter family protein [Galbibacter sp.]|jgi:hypothetical protein|uniref:GH3 auxin-responsive promoter family protein n=1 Tax=Galbibacter sp. TaxID=2918471 RepID=UPI003A92202E